MKKIALLNKLKEYILFNNKTIKEITKRSSEYSKLLIFRLKKEKLVFEIEKNKYSLHKDPLLIASAIVWPSYISCWSALRYYNLTTQLPTKISVITTRARKKTLIHFKNADIIFIKVKPKFFFGFKKERYGRFNIFIAEPEKALTDSALFKKISFSELWDTMKEHKKEINPGLLVAYLIKIKNKALVKRFGFVLDKLGFDFYGDLKKFIDSKYISLDYALSAKGKKNRKWKVIENVKL